MLGFLNLNKKLLTYSMLCLALIPLIGIKFFISIVGNILILLFLIPILLILVLFISFNSFKTKFNVCDECGSISIGSENTCMQCGAELDNESFKDKDLFKKPSERTVEIKAEEVK